MRIFKIYFYLFNLLMLTLFVDLFGMDLFAALPDKEYNVPLLFDVYDNGVKIGKMTTSWDLTKKDSLSVADVNFNDQTFRVDLKRLRKLVTKENLLEKEEITEWVLALQWPKSLFDEGILEVMDRSGKVIWVRDIKKNEIQDWTLQLEKWKKTALKSDPKFNFSNIPATKANVVFRQFKLEHQPFWTIEEPFKFCLSHEHEVNLRTRICTSFYEAIREEKEIQFELMQLAEVPARIIAFGENQKLKDEKEVKLGEPVQFFAELTTGSTFEFLAKPTRFNLVEVIDSDDGKGEVDKVKVMAWGPRPNIPVLDYKLGGHGVLEKWLGRSWSQTIGDLREFWEVKIPKENPVLYVPGLGGGLFKIQFEINNLPSEKIRPYLNLKTVDSTYLSNPVLGGRSPKQVQVSSKMNSLKMENANLGNFAWEYAAPKKGAFNKSIVQVVDGKNIFKAYREIYRGYPGEFAARGSGLVSSTGGMAAAYELGLKYWFESLAGWQNYYLSRQRWGVGYRNFQSLSPLMFRNYNDTLNYSILDLNYRLNPGIWSWDESWGLTFSSAQMSYNVFKTNMLGIGIFLGRSMPTWLDDVINYMPVFRKPKWVNIEYIYYPASQTTGISFYDLGSGYGNWILSTSSKIMWTNQFFSELAIGMRQADFAQSFSDGVYTRQRFQFTSIYGSIALGLNF